jgi:DNA invertase Pin-like site-specific DNA recombinase
VSQTIGYARVSAEDQNLDLQLDALKAAGCDRVFEEKASGALRERPELAKALDYIRPGDVLVVWKLDRLGRSMPHLLDTVAGLRKRGIEFRSLKENIDTTTATGRLIFHFFAMLAEFERDMIREPAAAGPAAAKARGETGGRPRLLDADKLAFAKSLLATKRTVRQAAQSVGVSQATLYRALAAESVAKLSDDTQTEAEVSETSFEMPEWLLAAADSGVSQK